MKFSTIKTLVLKRLGIKEFKKDKEGKLELSEKEKGELVELFGTEFPELFAKSFDQEEAMGEEFDAAAIVNALKTHSANVVGNAVSAIQAELNSEKNRNKQLQDLVDLMAASPETLPEAGTKPVNTPGRQYKVNRKLSMYSGVDAYLTSGNPSDFAAATIEVGDLKTEFGDFLSQNGNNLEIKKKLFTGFTSSKFFNWIRAVTEYRATQALITSVVQQFTAKWTPGGKVAFEPATVRNFRHKINVPIVPADVLTSYVFKLYDEGKSPDQMPITLYIWNELLYPAITQDIEMRMIYKAKYVDQSASNVATPPEDSMNGIETIIADARAAGNTGMHFFRPNVNFDFREQYNLGNYEAILNFVNDFVDWLSPWFRSQNMPVFMSPENITIYKRAYKKFWGMNSGQDGDFGSGRIDHSNKMIAAPDGMFKSPIIYTTPFVNQVGLRHINEIPNIINDVQKQDYEVRLFGEFWMGVGFLFPNAVFAYCPAGYDPKELVSATLGDFDTYQDDYDNGSGEPESFSSGI